MTVHIHPNRETEFVAQRPRRIVEGVGFVAAWVGLPYLCPG
jgi:hypothetical protein